MSNPAVAFGRWTLCVRPPLWQPGIVSSTDHPSAVLPVDLAATPHPPSISPLERGRAGHMNIVANQD